MPVSLPTRLGRLGVRVEDGPAPVALLWHSAFVDSHSWDRVLPVFSQLRTVVLVDGPSFGVSEPLARRATIEDCAHAAFEILDALGIEQVDWVGNGWGGHVGIVAAASAPRRVRSLASFSAPTHPAGGSERGQLRAFSPVVRALGFTGPVRRRILRSILNDRTIAIDPEAVRIVEDGYLHSDRRAVTLAMRSFVLDRPDLTEAAALLDTPTVFAVGDDRVEWTPAQARAVTDRMSDGRTRLLHGVRNIAPLEDPDAVAVVVRELWAATSRR